MGRWDSEGFIFGNIIGMAVLLLLGIVAVVVVYFIWGMVSAIAVALAFVGMMGLMLDLPFFPQHWRVLVSAGMILVAMVIVAVL